MIRQAVILVGGPGTRLGTLTTDTPKPLLPIAGLPFLNYLLPNLQRFGFDDFILLAQFQAEKIRNYCQTNPLPNANIRVIEEEKPAGTGGALRNAKAMLEETFLLANGDTIFDFNILEFVNWHKGIASPIALSLRKMPDRSRYGNVKVDASGLVTDYGEKSNETGLSGLINGGVYLMSRSVIDSIPPSFVSLETDIMPKMVAQKQVYGRSFEGYFLDIGLPSSYALAQKELPQWAQRKVVFFDRDGTLNLDLGYTYKIEDLVLLPGVGEVIRKCNESGRLAIVISNQGGIARGLYTAQDAHDFNAAMNARLGAESAHIDAFYFCPHHPDFPTAPNTPPCKCRKPGIGLFEQACHDWHIDLTDALMVGNKDIDMQAAAAFGIAGVKTNGQDLTALFDGREL